MSRRVVSEIQCSRCARVEISTGGVPTPVALGTFAPPAAFVATLGTERIQFEDLCGPCARAVKTHFDAIAKKIDGLSPERAPRKQVKPEVSIIDGAALKPATVTHVKKAKDA